MTNKLYIGDNLNTLRGLDSETVDLIYLDPPFNSKRIYHGTSSAAKAKFSDVWKWDEEVKKHTLELLVADYPNLADYIRTVRRIHSGGMAGYLLFMTHRLIELHRVLKPTGSLYLHCDPTASHYLKVVLDRIFGAKNFINEVIWAYDKWSNAANHYQRNHDVILFCAKNAGEMLFNKQYRQTEYQRDAAQKGWTRSGSKGNAGERLIVLDREKAAGKIAEYQAKGRAVHYRDSGDWGTAMADWWGDIKVLGSTAKERTGWPTQKPLALLRRIIEASSNPGDLVLDPFAGCGTATIAAEQLGRHWIGCDIDEECPDMMRLLRERVELPVADGYTVHKDAPPRRTDLRFMKPRSAFAELYGVQLGACGGCGKHKPAEDLEVDHIIPRRNGGLDCYENYQLLCSTCNRIKGARPMEYLLSKLEMLHDAKLRTEF